MPRARQRIARVLVVEDDRAFRDLVEEVLRRQGHVVVGEGTAEAALRRLASEHIDLLVLDMMLPDLLGDEMLERLHARGPSPAPAVVVMTAFRWAKEKRVALQNRFGVQSVLQKPFPVVEFLHAVATALGERGVPVTWRAPGAPAPPEASGAGPPAPPLPALPALAPQPDSARDPAPPEARPVLAVAFSSPAEFLQEYAANITSAGLFVATRERFPVRTLVRLAVRPPLVGEDSAREILLDAEVVYVREEDQAPAGVGVQISASPESLSALKAAVAESRAALRAGRPLRLVAAVSLPQAWSLQEAVPDAHVEVLEPGDPERLVNQMLAEPPDVLFIEAADDGKMAGRTVAAIRARPEFAAASVFVVGPESARSGALAGGPEAYFAVPEEMALLSREAASSFERAQVREIRVPLRAFVRLRMDVVSLHGDCIDVSLGGLSVALRARLDPGQVVDLELVFKDASPPVASRAQVIWAHEDRLAKLWRVGMMFRGMSAPVRARLHERIFFALQADSDAYLREVARPFEQAQRQEARVPYRGEVRLHVGPAVVYAEGVDISTGGIAVTARAQLQLGQHVDAEVALPDGHPPLRCRAQVVWLQDEPEGGLSRIGLRFEEPPELAVTRLRAYAAQAYRTPTPVPRRGG